MTSVLRRPAVAGLLAAGSLAGAVGGFAAAAPARPSTSAASGECPATTPLRLPADGLARAIDAALAQAPHVYSHTDTTGVRAVSAVLADGDPSSRGGQVRQACGEKVARRTVIVSLDFPALHPSASLSAGIVAVARIDGGYRVWRRLH